MEKGSVCGGKRGCFLDKNNAMNFYLHSVSVVISPCQSICKQYCSLLNSRVQLNLIAPCCFA